MGGRRTNRGRSSQREACLAPLHLEIHPQGKINLARPWLSQQRPGLTADDAHRARRTDIGGRSREVRVIQGVDHRHTEPQCEALPILEVFQKSKIEIADRRPGKNVKAGVAEPPNRYGIAAQGIGGRASGDGESSRIEPVTDGAPRREIPVTNPVWII